MAKGKRRRFGSIIERKSKSTGTTYYEARYQPPIGAYAKWPNLPKHITKNFPEGFESEAERWLIDAERAIQLQAWEPPQVSANTNAASRVTFAEYAADYVESRRKRNGDPLERTT